MKKVLWEIAISLAIVLIPTFFIYRRLAGTESFWNAQFLWSVGLITCWIIVASGYYHQGWLVRSKRRADDVSVVLPIAVFFVQCILFVKGIYYRDWSLVGGALLVNSGVVFSLSQIIRVRRRRK
ncbi:MAG: hypothetical protein HYV54_01555 [Parcubacteria group bacterium]|nr:hypothetical protein [Parcubacteria group bacterium]